MLIKNYDINNKLCNGTRLQVLKISEHILVCRNLTNPKKENDILIPIEFSYGGKINQSGITWKRIQFPIRLSFAMTLNKCQGQTLQRVGIYLKETDVFSHGHLYTALSRAKSSDAVKVVCNLENNKMSNTVKNIIYYDILDSNELNHTGMNAFLLRYKKCTRQFTEENKENVITNTVIPNEKISLESYQTLNDGEWISSEIIDVYLRYIRDCINDKSIAIMITSYSFSGFLRNRNAKSFCNRSRSHKIEMLLIPIHRNNHFVFAAYYNNVVKYYDSYGGYMLTDIENLIKKIMIDILPDTQYSIETVSIDNFNEQTDGYNCGIFVCHFGEQMIKNHIIVKDSNFNADMKRKELKELYKNAII